MQKTQLQNNNHLRKGRGEGIIIEIIKENSPEFRYMSSGFESAIEKSMRYLGLPGKGPFKPFQEV